MKHAFLSPLRWGATALCLACSGEVQTTLEDAGAEARGGSGGGGASQALAQLSLGVDDCVTLLLGAGADVRARVRGCAHRGATPLLLAAAAVRAPASSTPPHLLTSAPSAHPMCTHAPLNRLCAAARLHACPSAGARGGGRGAAAGGCRPARPRRGGAGRGRAGGGGGALGMRRAVEGRRGAVGGVVSGGEGGGGGGADGGGRGGGGGGAEGRRAEGGRGAGAGRGRSRGRGRGGGIPRPGGAGGSGDKEEG